MIGKKDNHDIFKRYKNVILEDVQGENDISTALINRVKTSAMDQQLKFDIIDYIQRCEMIISNNTYSQDDEDTVNKPDPKFGRELSTAKYGANDQDTANKPDPNFAKEMAREMEKQRRENPERN
jgi:hypothetical protein